MTRLIDADALKAVFEEKSIEAVCGVELCKAIISRIDNAPTVDAVSVRHARLVNASPYGECSYCGELIDSRDMFRYCPHCGAMLVGEGEEDETD